MQNAAQVVGVNTAHAYALGTARRTADELHVGCGDAKGLGDEPDHRGVGPPVRRRGAHLYLQRVAVATDDRAAAGPRLDVQAQDQIRSGVALSSSNVEQVLDHGRLL